MHPDPKILIVGGGIGGCVAALWLHRCGFKDITLFESVEEVKPLGVGINLLPHAVAELDALGLLDQLDATGIETKDLTYYNKFGQPIWTEPRGKHAGLSFPQYSIHRGKLQMILYNAAVERLGKERMRTGRTLSSFEQTPEGRVKAVFKNRRTGQVAETVEGDMMVAADGIHSTVRKVFYPDEGPPCFSGMLMWRGVAVTEPIKQGMNMMISGNLKQKFVACWYLRGLLGSWSFV